MPTVKEQIAAVRANYRKEKTDKFKQWTKDRFGRLLKKGDRLLHVPTRQKVDRLHFIDEPEIYEVIGYEWDYSNPSLLVKELEQNGTYKKICRRSKHEVEQSIARNVLKKCELVKKSLVPADVFEYAVQMEVLWPATKKRPANHGRYWYSETTTETFPTYQDARRYALKLARAHKGQVGDKDCDYISLYDRTGNCKQGWGSIMICSRMKAVG